MKQEVNMAAEIARKLFVCPEIDSDDHQAFPPAEEELLMMETTYEADTSSIFVFPFVRVREDNDKYVEIYMWDSMLYPNSYERFIIKDGFRMSDDKEKELLSYVRRRDVFIYTEAIESFIRVVKKEFPHWNVINYSPYRIGILLEHMYFACHKSGPKEILYKAGLSNIAFNIDKIYEYNIIGTSPEDIIGHNLPMRLLRILDKNGLTEELYDAQSMRMAADIYKNYSGYIKEKVYNGQWRYLKELSSPTGLFADQRFNRALFNRLAALGSEYALESYRSFFRLKSDLPEIKDMKIPDLRRIDDVVDKINSIYDFKDKKDILNEKFMYRKRKCKYDYEYKGQKLSVVMPCDAGELYREALYQENCLINYIDSHAIGDTTILFIRKNSSSKKTYITMEIDGKDIKQVYGRYNSLPAKEVFAFLEEYSREKGVYYNPYELINSCAGIDSSKHIDELYEYIEGYRRRNSRAVMDCPDDGIDYVQYSLKDLCPEMFN